MVHILLREGENVIIYTVIYLSYNSLIHLISYNYLYNDYESFVITVLCQRKNDSIYLFILLTQFRGTCLLKRHFLTLTLFTIIIGQVLG